MDLKNCPKCGAPCPLVGQFCPSCGHKFNKKNINHTQKQEPAKTEPKKAPEEVAKEKAEKSIRIREKVAQEILSTEKSYIKSLNLVCDKFLGPLRKAEEEGRPIISVNDIQMVFSVIGIIRDLNKKFLTDLEPLITGYTQNTCLGKVILDFAPYFKMYTQYVNAHEADAAQQYLKKLDQKAPNSPFKAFCYDICKAAMCLPLPALLITPVQRIPRYRLLVAEYLKHTDPSHADYKDLQQALEKIKETAFIINEAVRRQQQRQTVVDLEGKFSSNPGFVAPSRIFKYQGPLMKKCRADDRKYEFFLFNDLFVYGRETSKERYVLHKKIPIDKAFNVEVKPDAEDQFSFMIRNSVKSFIVYARTDNEKNEWLGKINEVLQERATALNKGDSDFVAPVWETDNKKECQRQRKPDGTMCCNKFTFLIRRHHCRQCGVLCCHECSPYNVYLSASSKKKERACTECIDKLMELDINKGLVKPELMPRAHARPPASTSSMHATALKTSLAINSPSSSAVGSISEITPKRSGPAEFPPPVPIRSPNAVPVPEPPKRVNSTPAPVKPPPSLPPRRPPRKTGAPLSNGELPDFKKSRRPPPVPPGKSPVNKRAVSTPVNSQASVPTPPRRNKQATATTTRRKVPTSRPPALPSSKPPSRTPTMTRPRKDAKTSAPPSMPTTSPQGLSKPPPPRPLTGSPRLRPSGTLKESNEQKSIRTLGRTIGKLKKNKNNTKIAAIMAKFQQP
ncbi:hypothetical protein AAMO2058_000431000 [Amorphochlora amoebiformis]|mmetsp:Transcript_19081/g.30336  ORF Transcript_19081/g.30336 Transcript_19081/m.30336 type:complete len:735 (-) Transcript_19081:189-2393(-)